MGNDEATTIRENNNRWSLTHAAQSPWLLLVLATTFSWQYRLEPHFHLWMLLVIVLAIAVIQSLLPSKWHWASTLTGTLIGSIVLLGPIPTGMVLTSLTAIILLIRFFHANFGGRLLLPGVVASVLSIGTFLQFIWPTNRREVVAVLGILLMFRLPYLFLALKKNNGTIWTFQRCINYFLLLPNVAMTVFPVVRPNDSIILINQRWKSRLHKKGAVLVSLGILQLFLYRVMFSHGYILPENVDNIFKLFHHTTINYLLLIRVSGLFYVATGILNLLGMPVNSAFRSFLTAKSPLDLCRRFHTSLTTFLNRLFYSFTQQILNRTGKITSLVLGSYSLFFWAWMAHSLQWFWINGHFPLRWSDLIFWSAFGAAVSAELSIGRKIKFTRVSRQPTLPHRKKSIYIMTTFIVVSQLWSIQAFHAPSQWLAMWQNALRGPGIYWAYLMIILTVIFIILLYSNKFHIFRTFQQKTSRIIPKLLAFTLLTLSVSQAIVNALPNDSQNARTWNKTFQGRNLPQSEIALTGGYFSAIVPMTQEMEKSSTKHLKTKERFEDSPGATPVDDFRQIAQAANISFIFKGKPYTTNSMGFRDKEYALKPDSGTIRTLILGSSFVTGAGVSDHDVFDVILEQKMNETTEDRRYEFINAGCSTYDLIDCMVRYDNEDLSNLSPDYLFIFSHGIDKQKNTIDLARAIRKNIAIPYPYLNDIILKAGVADSMGEASIIRKLQPYSHEIIKESYQNLYKKCIQAGIVPVWVYWPTIGLRPTMELEVDEILQVVNDIGYKTIHLEDAYEGHSPSTLYVAPDDRHPNAKGHRLFAEALMDVLMNDPAFKDHR